MLNANIYIMVLVAMSASYSIPNQHNLACLIHSISRDLRV